MHRYFASLRIACSASCSSWMVVQTKVSDLLAKNPVCAACEYLPRCCGGCMVEGITDEGDYLVPDGRCCYFHQHIGENAVRAVADAAIRKYYGECHL